MQDQAPWEIHPDLTEDRLRVIAEIIRSVRHDAIDENQPEKGDTNWGLGCRVHERTCFALRELERAVSAPWLSVIEPGLRFVFKIGAVPVRFYHGDADRPNARSARRHEIEIEQHQRAFEFASAYGPSDLFWRLVIETHIDNTVNRAVMVQLDEAGNPYNPWTVPLDDNVRALAPVLHFKKEGVELPPVTVEPKAPDIKIDTPTADDDK